ncbi:MAG TPA: YciI family protein [Candidatus Cybelea sp.]|jgi:uncharacterized protein YciI|nr:YciI family protein [Candidatus Cybelea sp.]
MIFVVIRRRSDDWDWALPMRSQPAWDVHAAYMDALAEEGFILAGGPLGSEDEAARVMHVVEAPDERTAIDRFERDPWTLMDLLHTVSVEPWSVLLGGFARTTA